MIKLDNGKITGEEFYCGRDMKKSEYLSLKHFDDRIKDEDGVFRLLNESVFEFLEINKGKTLIPVVSYVNNKEVKEMIKIIWDD